MASQLETYSSLLPPKLVLCDRLTHVEDDRLRWNKPGLTEGEALILPNEWQAPFQERLQSVHHVLADAARKIQGCRTRSEDDDKRMIRGLVNQFFPVIGAVMRHKKNEERFFHGDSAERYVQRAFEGTKDFRRWVLGQLPPSLHQPLGLTVEVENASGFLDLLKLYGGISIGSCTYVERNRSRGTVYSPFVSQQVASSLECMNLYAFADLTREPEEERLLRQFIDDSGRVFSGEPKKIYLIVFLDNEGKCVQMTISDGKDWQSLFDKFQSGKYLIQELRVRPFGRQQEEFAMADHRYKSVESEISKIARGRPLPLSDRQAARFILHDKKHLDGFVDLLKDRMPEWAIEKEGKPTVTPASRIEQVKYHAWHKDDPSCRIEVVFEWLLDSGYLLGGSWVPYQFERGKNWHEFRMRQFVKEGILQALFPYPLYGRDWNDPRMQKILYDHAYEKAIAGRQPNTII